MSRGRQTGRAPPGGGPGADRSAFVSRLRQILEHWPSADRLARETGVSPSAFRKWLKGEAEPSRERLVALADVARVGIGWLASGEPPEPVFPQGGAEKRGKGAAADHGTALSRFLVLPKQPEAAAAGAATPSAPAESEYIAYVSEQNLLADTSGTPIRHPDVADVFEWKNGAYRQRDFRLH